MENNGTISTESLPTTGPTNCCCRPFQAGRQRRPPTWIAWSTPDGRSGPGDQSRPHNRCITCTISQPGVVLLHVSVGLNIALLVAGIAVYVRTKSQLVLVQTTDSLLDVGANAILAYSARFGRRPADVRHQYGHQRAEPLGALVVAVVTCVLAVEVLASAILDLVTAAHPDPDISIAAVLGSKAFLKVALIAAVLRLTNLKPSSDVGLNALFVDTRNDVVVCIFSLGGYALVVAGHGWVDGFLAILVAIYVAFNGYRLAVENLMYLVGGAPPDEIVDEIRRAASTVTGVERVGHIKAQYLGTELQAEVRIFVCPNLSVEETIVISEAVRRSLVHGGKVQMVSIYVDVEGDDLEEAHPNQIMSRSQSQRIHHHISLSDTSTQSDV